MIEDSRLILVDAEVRRISRDIDRALWDNPRVDVSFLELELSYYMNLQEKGQVYEPTF